MHFKFYMYRKKEKNEHTRHRKLTQTWLILYLPLHTNHTNTFIKIRDYYFSHTKKQPHTALMLAKFKEQEKNETPKEISPYSFDKLLYILRI